MAAATARRTRKTQPPAEGQQQEPRPERHVDKTTGEVLAAQPDAKAQAAPEPAITVDPVPVTYYRPSVTMPDGTVIVCEHKYLHESEKAAAACGRRIAANGAFAK